MKCEISEYRPSSLHVFKSQKARVYSIRQKCKFQPRGIELSFLFHRYNNEIKTYSRSMLDMIRTAFQECGGILTVGRKISMFSCCTI